MSEALEENAAELQFGSPGDFEVGWPPEASRDPNVQVLSNDEVFYLMELQRQDKLKPGHSVDELNDTFRALHAHLEKVVTTRNLADLNPIASNLGQTLEVMQFELDRPDRKLETLHPYEKTSLCNLLKSSDTTAEEVKHWVPSLCRFPDSEIEKALAEIIRQKGAVIAGL